jgi:6-methylsalicylic acid synthase
MALVQLPFEQVESELLLADQAAAAIRSSPTSCVVSGTTEALEIYLRDLSERNVPTWKVQTDIAFHSPALQELVVPLRDALGHELCPRPSMVPIYSTSHLDSRTTDLRGSDYWTNNMTQPVWLVDAVEAAVQDGYRIFLEISSHPIVSHSITDTLNTRSVADAAAFGVMGRRVPFQQGLSHAVSRLHTLGADVDFHAFLGTGPWSTAIPNTPWVHKPYWKTIKNASSSIRQQHVASKHTLLGSVVDIASSDMKVWTTSLDDKTKPYPLSHPLDGTEIIPAGVYCNTFRGATSATVLKDVQLRVPTPMTADQREVQVIAQGGDIRMSSRLISCENQSSKDVLEHTWIEHGTAKHYTFDMTIYQQRYSLPALQQRIGRQLPKNFAWEYLQKIGVSGIAFPWAVLEHFGNNREMLVKMDMDPNSESISWSKDSWAPFLDAATSVGSSIFFESVRMRIVSGIDEVQFVSKEVPPKIGYLFIENRSEQQSPKADISILSQDGTLLAKVQGMRFSDVEAQSEKSTGLDSLVHQLTWIPPTFSEAPSPIRNVVFVSDDSEILDNYINTLELLSQNVTSVLSCDALREPETMSMLQEKGAMVIYLPGPVHGMEDVSDKVHKFIFETASILKFLAMLESYPKLYVITDSAYKSQTPTALAQYPLYGFARVAASEYPETWGGLIDNEGPAFPLLPVKYVHDQSVIRIQDGLPRVARMRPFQKSQRPSTARQTLMPRPHGTYVVTGGFGDVGLETLEFLVQKGARRIVVVSRRKLPPRRDWSSVSGSMATVVQRIEKLENLGASIHAVTLDIGSSTASSDLLAALDNLSLPPVLGVVHAAGVSGYGYIKDATSDSFVDVLSPKVQGALSLNEVFPPGSLDFFICFSSIGQIIGTPGQCAYASSNAFLDSLATHRRAQGCNSIAIQWTAWRGLGLASDTALVDLELQSKGVTDITVDEGFSAWEYLSGLETDHAVVTRTRILDAGEPLPCPLIEDVVQRRAAPTTAPPSPTASAPTTPKTGPELESHIRTKIRTCLSVVLHMDAEDIDDRAAVADLGVDSVMTVALRQQLQKTMGVKVPPTLTWNHPTIQHLVKWFYAKLDNSA